ncbi:MAG: hypothetical protein EOP37_03250 [Rubrivivax sp.]|nr:MAG: hypothetical protein EOP37_03250 [Rubrivivax sp.]
MTIQFLRAWNGNEQFSVATLSGPEEARLIGLRLARAWTGPDNPSQSGSSPVSVVGDVVVGRSLVAAVAAGWTISGGQWYRDGNAIGGATGLSYVVQPADVGPAISFVPAGLPFRAFAVPGILAAGAMAPYDANVLSRTLVPNAVIAAATARSANWRRVDYARMSASLVKVRMPNFYYNAGNELGPGSFAQQSVSIEYPIGTTPQVFLFGGNVIGNTQNNNTLESDSLQLNVPLVFGAKMFFHTWTDCGGGLVHNRTSAYLGEDGVEMSASTLPSRVATGGSAYGTASTGQSFGPSALICSVTGATVSIPSDSNGLGAINLVTTNFPASDEFGYQGWIARAIAPSMPCLNLGSYGDSLANYITANGTKRKALALLASDIVFQLGINDIVNATRTGAATYADQLTLKGQIGTGKRTYICKLPPCTTGAWTNADGSDQTVRAVEAERLAYNALVDANSGGFDVVIDPTPFLALAGGAKFKAPGYTVDGTHLTVLAQLAAAGAVNLAAFQR